jgi:hypothetical protein
MANQKHEFLENTVVSPLSPLLTELHLAERIAEIRGKLGKGQN